VGAEISLLEERITARRSARTQEPAQATSGGAEAGVDAR
jgi:hypothetical protein